MRNLVLAAAVFLLGALALKLDSESLTLSTSYPAPSGVYQALVTTGGSTTSPVNTVLVRDAGNVGVGTASPQTPAPNGAAGGNVTANDVYLSSSKQWLSQNQGLNVQSFNANGTFTVPAGVSKILVEVWGAGGGGCGGSGGAGGGGGYALCPLSVSAGQSYTVTVGKGGAGASAPYPSCTGAQTGGTSSFVGTGINCNATAGQAGNAGGGAGGKGANGVVNWTGGDGDDLACASGVFIPGRGGRGAQGGDGGAIIGGCSAGSAFAGKAPGGGGGAVCWDAVCTNAGPGADGAVTVRW